MVENLFFDAMDTDLQMAINETKLNKQFALQLINDLDAVFKTNYEGEDQRDSVVIRMKKYPTNNWYGSFSFSVTKVGITFHSKNLGYYHATQFKDLGGLYEKYKDNGAVAEPNFLKEGTSGFGYVSFNIRINRNGVNLKDALKDIVYLMEQDGYIKRF